MACSRLRRRLFLLRLAGQPALQSRLKMTEPAERGLGKASPRSGQLRGQAIASGLVDQFLVPLASELRNQIWICVHRNSPV